MKYIEQHSFHICLSFLWNNIFCIFRSISNVFLKFPKSEKIAWSFHEMNGDLVSFIWRSTSSSSFTVVSILILIFSLLLAVFVSDFSFSWMSWTGGMKFCAVAYTTHVTRANMLQILNAHLAPTASIIGPKTKIPIPLPEMKWTDEKKTNSTSQRLKMLQRNLGSLQLCETKHHSNYN